MWPFKYRVSPQAFVNFRVSYKQWGVTNIRRWSYTHCHRRTQKLSMSVWQWVPMSQWLLLTLPGTYQVWSPKQQTPHTEPGMFPAWLPANILPKGKDREIWSRLNYTGSSHSRECEYSQCRPGPKALKLLLSSFFFHCSSCLPLNDNSTTLHPVTRKNTSGSCLRDSRKWISFFTASVSLDSSPVLWFLRQVGKVSMFSSYWQSGPWMSLAKETPKHTGTPLQFSTLYSGLCTKFTCPHLLQV